MGKRVTGEIIHQYKQDSFYRETVMFLQFKTSQLVRVLKKGVLERIRFDLL